MLKRALGLAVISVLVSGAIGARADYGFWAEANMPLCCKKARSSANMREVSIARLCCKLNCSEPASGGSSTATNLSNNPGTPAATAIIPAATNVSSFALRYLHLQVTHSHDSNPKYIQHLALLI